MDAGFTLSEFRTHVGDRLEPLLTAQEKLQLSIDIAETAGLIADRLLSAEKGQAVARFQQIRALLANAHARSSAL